MSLFNLFKASEPSPGKMSRETIQALSGKIRLSDTDQDAALDLYCYNKCDNTESDLVKNCRGVIFHSNTVVMKGFPFTEEFTTDDSSFSELKTKVAFNSSEYKFYDAHEGALLRVFNWQSKWYITTHRKLDAFRSKWASKESFGQMFKSALEVMWEKRDPEFMRQCWGDDWKDRDDTVSNVMELFLDTLDVTKQYMFLILNNYDNRIVCVSNDEPTVYHVGTIGTTEKDGVRVPDDIWDLKTRVGIVATRA